MKQFLLILSAAIFLVGGAGYYLAVTIMDQKFKDEMAQSIKSSACPATIQISVSKTELQNSIRFTGADHKEFIYLGKHYDVVQTVEKPDGIVFTCVNDEKETLLFAHLDRQLSDPSSSNNASGKYSLKTFLQDWFFQKNTSTVSLNLTVLHFSAQVSLPSGLTLKVLSPPPKS